MPVIDHSRLYAVASAGIESATNSVGRAAAALERGQANFVDADLSLAGRQIDEALAAMPDAGFLPESISLVRRAAQQVSYARTTLDGTRSAHQTLTDALAGVERLELARDPLEAVAAWSPAARREYLDDSFARGASFLRPLEYTRMQHILRAHDLSDAAALPYVRQLPEERSLLDLVQARARRDVDVTSPGPDRQLLESYFGIEYSRGLLRQRIQSDVLAELGPADRREIATTLLGTDPALLRSRDLHLLGDLLHTFPAREFGLDAAAAKAIGDAARTASSQARVSRLDEATVTKLQTLMQVAKVPQGTVDDLVAVRELLDGHVAKVLDRGKAEVAELWTLPDAELDVATRGLLDDVIADGPSSELSARTLAHLFKADETSARVTLPRVLNDPARPSRSLPSVLMQLLPEHAPSYKPGTPRPTDELARYQEFWRWHRDRDYRAEFVRAHDAAVDAAVAGTATGTDKARIVDGWKRFQADMPYRPRGEQLAIARTMLGSSLAHDRGVRSVLETLHASLERGGGTEQTARLWDETRELLERNLARLNGELQDSYLNHPDYAEVGRIQANVDLIERFRQAGGTTAESAPVANATSETLSW